PEPVMTQHELETEVTALALSGGVVMLTDNMACLTDARKSYVDAFIPVYPTPARPVDLFNGKPCPEVFHQKVRTDSETYDVIAVFNWEDAPRAIEVPLDGIDLEPAERRVAFEYWTQTFLRTVQHALDLDEIPAHGVRVIALRALREHPFVMGTSLHVTQGGVELSGQTWDQRKQVLGFTVSSWARCPRSVHVHVPDGLALDAVRCTSNPLSHDLKSPHHLLVEYEAGGTVRFEVSFRPRA
ncbi:MAG TPA: hypothetical protein VMX57_04020, partial [Planctomycetota bacterium]|nr:hypothetical protein [Planctomycetota bacterium]